MLGRQVDASAVGRVEVAGNDIVITADQAEIAGVEVPQAALDIAARLLSFTGLAERTAAVAADHRPAHRDSASRGRPPVSDDAVLRRDRAAGRRLTTGVDP